MNNHAEFENKVRALFKETMPSDYPFNIVYIYGYMEIVPDEDSQDFSKEELASLIDVFSAKLLEETNGVHSVGGYKISGNTSQVKLHFVTVV